MKKSLVLPVVAVSFLLGALAWDGLTEHQFLRRIRDKVASLNPPPRPELGVRPIRRFSYTPPEAGTGPRRARTPWPTFHRDNRRTGASPLPGPQRAHIRWVHPTGGIIESSPAIGPEGNIYIGSHDGFLYAMSPAGEELWKFQTNGLIRSSPAVTAAGDVYVGSFQGGLYALRPDGELKWSYYSGARVLTSPAIGPEGNIYFASQDGVLHSVNPDGLPNWQLALDGDVSVSSPAIAADGTIYQTTYRKGMLYAIRPDGTIRWQLRLTRFGVRTTPALGADGTLYLGDRNGTLFAIDPDGEIRWRFSTGNDIRSSAAVGPDGTIYFGGYDQYLYAVTPEGKLRWKTRVRGPIEVSPAVDGEGNIYVGAQSDQFHCIGPDGAIRWSFKRGVIYTSPAIGPDHTVYTSSDYAIMAVGEPLPALAAGGSGTAPVEVRNAASRAYSTELYAWGRTADGRELRLLREKLELAPQSRVERQLDIPAAQADQMVYIGARLLDATNGKVLSTLDRYLGP